MICPSSSCLTSRVHISFCGILLETQKWRLISVVILSFLLFGAAYPLTLSLRAAFVPNLHFDHDLTHDEILRSGPLRWRASKLDHVFLYYFVERKGPLDSHFELEGG